LHVAGRGTVQDNTMTARFATVTMLAVLVGLRPANVVAQEWPDADAQALSGAELMADHQDAQEPELPRGFERIGDMVLELVPGPMAATGFVAQASSLWANGVVPVVFDAAVTQQEAQFFLSLCNGVWGGLANVRCVTRTTEPSWVAVTKANSGCYSWLGGPRPGSAGPRPLNLQANACWTQQTVLHELGHALGFMHEHQRPDRDQFIEIRTQNIPSGSEAQFAIIHQGNGDYYTRDYDFGSIMHYPGAPYVAGQPIIVPRPQYAAIAGNFGTTENPSPLDGVLMRYLYGAPSISVPGAPTSLNATASGNKVTITWGAPASGGTPTSYFVTVKNQIGAVIASGDVGNGLSAVATVQPGTYVIMVQAKNAAGTGAAATRQVTVGSAGMRPGAPANLVATVQGSTLTLSWSAPVTPGSIQSYVLRYGFEAGLATSYTADLGNVTRISFSGVAPGTYYLRVAARNQAGLSSDSNEVRVVIGSNAPAAPSFFPVQMRGTNVFYLSWAPGAGPTPSYYLIDVSSRPGGTPDLGTVQVSGTSLQTGAVARGTYYLRIRAVTAAGVSAPSEERVLVAR
jgi:hypothetical protein